ncbi:unnamed protein product [Durusdinium trenchii]|uniref:Pentatricopeptide repeat-containing protein, chloroplastic n=1 Tax=Durusdinium trenchii TaxID=1381693 RepID=A0ABP0QE24_9DINO
MAPIDPQSSGLLALLAADAGGKAIEEALQICHRSPQLVTKFLKGVAREQTQAAVEILDFLVDQDVEVNTFYFNSIIGSAGWVEALNIMQRMQASHISFSQVTYGAAIKSCSKANQWIPALSLLASMETSMMPNEIVFSSAIKSFEAEGLWQNALYLLLRMSQMTLQADVVCTSAAMAASVAAGRWQVALQLFQGMLDKVTIAGGVAVSHPDVISFNTLLTAMELSSWELCLSVLQEANQLLVTPNMISFNSAIGACDRAGKWECAIGLMEQASRARLRKNIITCNSCINACLQSSCWTISLQLLYTAAYCRLNPDVVSFTSALSVCSRAGFWQVAICLFQDMKRNTITPNEVACGALMVALNAKWEMSLNFLDELWRSRTLNSATCNAAISSLKWECALQLLQRMKSEKLADEITWNTAISVCGHSQQWQWALELLAHTDGPGLVSFNTAISACEKGDGWPAALALLSEMPEKYILPDIVSLNAAMTACASRWQIVLCLLNSCIWQVRKNIVSYNIALSSCEKSSSWEMALCILESIPTLASPNEISYAAAITACGKGQQWRLALDMFESIAPLKERISCCLAPFDNGIFLCTLFLGQKATVA